MKRPTPLKSGDKVALTAPSSPVPKEILDTSVQSIRFLGLDPVVMPSCSMQHGYLAGDDMQRASDLNTAFADKTIKGIFCLRGGYGATRILPHLDLETIQKNPKIFIGYSDITALHLTFTQHCGFMTFHGPMPNTGYAEMDPFSLRSLKQNLFSDTPPGPVTNPASQPLETICAGEAAGMITGGNLSLLLATLGSPYEVDTRGKILFIEEVGERPYRIDKSLTALALAGKFSQCTGIILGTFADCAEPPAGTPESSADIADASLSLSEIFQEVIKPHGKPTINNFRAGHVYPQSTIPMGSFVHFNTNEDTVVFQT